MSAKISLTVKCLRVVCRHCRADTQTDTYTEITQVIL